MGTLDGKVAFISAARVGRSAPAITLDREGAEHHHFDIALPRHLAERPGHRTRTGPTR